MLSTTKALGFRLSALHAASFVGIGVYLSFFPVWLASTGMSPTTVGFVLAIPIVVRIIVTAPLLSLADRRIGPRRLLLACHLFQPFGYGLLFFLVGDLAIAAVIAALSVAQASVMPGNDLVTTNAIRGGARLNYGRVRVWGSIAFLSASILTGYLVEGIGPTVILWGLALTPLLAVVATAAAIPPGSPERAQREAVDPKPSSPLPKALWVIMAAASLTQASHAALYAFGSIHWRSIAFPDAVIGYLWAAGVVAEIVVFYLLGRVVGGGRAALWLIALGAGAVMIRFGVMATDPSLVVTFALQAMHGLTFGASHLGVIAMLAALAPAEAKGRAQGLYVSMTALAMAAATILSGPIYRAGGPVVFAAMVPLGFFGLLLTVAAARMIRQPAAGVSTG
jgi:PPP family 3-phenylpropionic acid transporter